MKLKQWFALLPLTLALTSPAMAGEVNQEMRAAGTALSTLVPYVFDDMRFRAPENQPIITRQLEQLIQSMEKQPHLLERHAVVKQISQTSLVNQLKQARQLYNTGNYATAQYLLGSVPALCSSCHIQDGIMASTSQPVSRDLFANAFSYAEFNFYLRHYDAAEAAYLEYLNRPEVRTSRISGGKTLERLLDISLISDANLDTTRNKLTRYRSVDGLDPDLQERIGLWLNGVEQLQQRNSTFKPVEIQMYEVFGANFNLKHEYILDETTRPLALAWRAQLQKTVTNTDNRTELARNLYLIAILERMLGDQSELSLANLYLKECVKLGVKDYSHRCLNEFESHLYFYYGGTGNDTPPPEAMDELRKLRKMARQSG